MFIPSGSDLDKECDRVEGKCSKCKYKDWCDNSLDDQEALFDSLDEW